MKFLREVIISALLAATDARMGSANRNKLAQRDQEDFTFWRGLQEDATSFPLVPTTPPVVPPTEAPIPAPSSPPSDPPVIPPSDAPIVSPSDAPFAAPVVAPVGAPIVAPAAAPIAAPAAAPIAAPAAAPFAAPVVTPSDAPVAPPTDVPIAPPTDVPIAPPTDVPVAAPVGAPVAAPFVSPVAAPIDAPVSTPSDVPLPPPTDVPVIPPTEVPVAPPAVAPAAAPFVSPVAAPIDAPVSAPSDGPLVTPTDAPVAVPSPPPVAGPTPPPVAGPTPLPVTPTSPPGSVSAVQMKLTPFALNGGAEFEDPESYQSKALRQVEAQVGVESFTDAKLVQYYALYSIYFATNMVPNPITDEDPRFVGIPFPGWLISTGWQETTLDPCDGWYGIACDSQGRVSTIDLFENLLTGSFPPEVSLLALDGPTSTGAGNLFRLDLFRNEFVWNSDDSSWMSDLGSNMTTIIVEETSFGGDIPRLPENIANFDVSFAFYTGGLIDENFAGLNQLSFLDLDGNAFNSSVPTVLGQLPNLAFLYVSDAFISGDLSFMNGMPSIRELWIDTNPGLSGPVFPFIGSLSTLESFSATFNSLTGTLPDTLGGLTSMQQMWLYSNMLTGQITSSLGSLPAMRILQLEGNSFTGSMPAEVCANTMFPSMVLQILGADCEDPNFTCGCCTCCSVAECNTE